MKSKFFPYLLAATLMATAALLAYGMISFQEEPVIDEQQRDVLHVKVQEVFYDTLDAVAEYKGRVSSYEEVALSSEVTGRILSGDVPLKEGQSFKKRDQLIRIYSEDAHATLRSARSSYLQLLAEELADISIDYPKQYDKWKTFFNNIDINEELPPLPEFDSEQERVFLASRNILSEYYAIEQQEINYKKYIIEAPFDGTYKTVNKHVGAVAGVNTELATIIRTDHLEATISVMPVDAEWLVEGMAVELIRENGDRLIGKINRIADFIDLSTQSVSVFVNIYQQIPEIRAGEYVEARFTRSNFIEGYKLPREALLDNNQVYVVTNGQLNLYDVHVVLKMDDHVIINGLPEGTQVVTESLMDVRENQEVETR
ncbi:efflux RND transporter periplasmic adaptor subunit [Gracilimonas mengyeensis]|uniref:RND family efflux transporter, MFP subunit n=1 Tax=Gracilimonas mengyeensis TaxID=1302730 RepID=A0A521BV70_9BACT|nr:efflux RND transporter periplasmic adaptor subunit [Gracilimonas mengyeensis]SMO51063.1 RND family efflux transporter, MFP subunit [Gracilimonas mengyeensis]